MNANSFPAVGEQIGQWKLIRLREQEDFSTRCYDVRHQETGQIGLCEMEVPNANAQIDMLVFHGFKAMIVKEMTNLGLASFQRFIEYGRASDDRYAYLITEGVGPTLHTLRRSLPPIAQNRFTLATGLYIGQKMLFALQEFHDAGYLHRCIKDEEFALRRKLTSELILIIDFGMVRRWMKFDGSGALRPRTVAAFRGTLKFSSINALRQHEQHRLDDVWAWFYVIVDMTVGNLPWEDFGLPDESVHEVLRLYADAKEAANKETSWLDTAPPEFKEVLEYLKSTPSDAEPEYSRLAKLLGNAFKRTVDENGGQFKLDWEPGGAYYEQLHPVLPNDQM